jgi:hypothetical protein
MAEGESQPVLENVITSEQPAATEELKIEEAPASDANQQSTEIKAEGSGKLENSSENQGISKK